MGSKMPTPPPDEINLATPSFQVEVGRRYWIRWGEYNRVTTGVVQAIGSGVAVTEVHRNGVHALPFHYFIAPPDEIRFSFKPTNRRPRWKFW